MHPYHHAATVQYGQPQQRQTYIHSVAGQPVQMQQPMQPMQPQIQGQASTMFHLIPLVIPLVSLDFLTRERSETCKRLPRLVVGHAIGCLPKIQQELDVPNL